MDILEALHYFPDIPERLTSAKGIRLHSSKLELCPVLVIKFKRNGENRTKYKREMLSFKRGAAFCCI